MYKVSEYAWDSRASDLSRLDTIDSTSSRGLPRSYDKLYLFTSNGFILLLGGNHEEDEDQHQLMTLYDVSTNEWQNNVRILCHDQISASNSKLPVLVKLQ
jgi:hypothetical protein